MHAWRPVLHASRIVSISDTDTASRDDEISSRNVMSSVRNPVSAVLPVNIPLDVRVSRSRVASAGCWWEQAVVWVLWDDVSSVMAGPAQQGHGGPGRCRGWWVWVSVLYCQHQPPARVNGPVGTRQCRAGCHQPLQRKILSLKWTLVAIPYCEGNSLWWDNARKKIYYCGWIGAMLSSLACGHSSVILITQL